MRAASEAKSAQPKSASTHKYILFRGGLSRSALRLESRCSHMHTPMFEPFAAVLVIAGVRHPVWCSPSTNPRSYEPTTSCPQTREMEGCLPSLNSLPDRPSGPASYRIVAQSQTPCLALAGNQTPMPNVPPQSGEAVLIREHNETLLNLTAYGTKKSL